MKDTCGPSGSTSSASAALQLCLENRLQARLQTLGSTMYKLTWKPWIMPSQRVRSRLRASVPRTSGIAPTGWVTPTTRDWKDSGADIKPRSDTGQGLFDQLPRQANLCGWPTATSNDSLRHPSENFETKNVTLNHAAVIAGWPTARAADGEKNVRTADGSLREIERKGSPQDLSMAVAITAGWPSPVTVPDSKASHGQLSGGLPPRSSEDATIWPGPTNGFWGAADWLFCRDGKWRPVEPGTFPLAHGVPARVVRLRGYGNAIVIPEAVEFILAADEGRRLGVEALV